MQVFVEKKVQENVGFLIGLISLSLVFSPSSKSVHVIVGENSNPLTNRLHRVRLRKPFLTAERHTAFESINSESYRKTGLVHGITVL